MHDPKSSNEDPTTVLQPLVKSGFSLIPDMKDGWKPEKKVFAAPIPLRFKDNDMDRVEV